MESLPDELILHITSFLSPAAIARLQQVSRRLHSITRDDGLWKALCFHYSKVEQQRRRQQLMSTQEPGIVALREALPSLTNPNAPNAEMSSLKLVTRERRRLLSNWDPSYPGENIDFYQEYIQRHAPILLNWLEPPRDGPSRQYAQLETLGVATIQAKGSIMAEKVLAPLEDGSVAIWDISSCESYYGAKGLLTTKTAPGLLSASQTWSRDYIGSAFQDNGAVDNVSIDSAEGKAYIGSSSFLFELDLETLQVIRKDTYPFAITALSEASHPTPLTVGTVSTIHLYDSRAPATLSSNEHSRCELIGGTPPQFDGFTQFFRPPTPTTHAPLAEPGPLSILHLPFSTSDWDGNGDIWVAGRFSSLLNYDRRQWPRLRGTVHSGARLSCLSSLPYPYIPRELDLMQSYHLSTQDVAAAKAVPGRTIYAAGEYKGKGSLELYGLSSDPLYTTLSSECSPDQHRRSTYKNRQTASSSRLLSVSPHGTRIVFSDGNGNLKWMERDGKTGVRTFNMNQHLVDRGHAIRMGPPSNQFHGPQADEDQPGDSASTAGDFIKKILPTHGSLSGTHNRDDLLIWSGEGHLGLVSFGGENSANVRSTNQSLQSRRLNKRWHVPSLSGDTPIVSDRDWEEEASDAAAAAAREEERAYGLRMRRALERQADEMRFVRGLGLAGRW